MIFQPDLNKLGGPVAIFKAVVTLLKMILKCLVLLGYDFHQYQDFNNPIPALDGGKIVLLIIGLFKTAETKIETYVAS